jgi:hypothetical protein
MLPEALDDNVLINMVNSGLSLRRIRTKLRYGPRFIFNRLKQLGIVDKNARITDYILPEISIKTKASFDFTYEDYLKYRVEQKLSLEEVSQIIGIEDYEIQLERLLSADKKHRRRYKASLQKIS